MALDLDHQDLALVGDAYSGALERRSAPGHGPVVQQHVHDAVALRGERREAADADPGLARNLAQPGQLTRPVLKNNCPVRGHRILIVAPRPAPGNPAATGPARRHGGAAPVDALTAMVFGRRARGAGPTGRAGVAGRSGQRFRGGTLRGHGS
jgi:hypothetical protein